MKSPRSIRIWLLAQGIFTLLSLGQARGVVISNDSIRSVFGGNPRPTNSISYDLNQDGMVDLMFTASASTFRFTVSGPGTTSILVDPMAISPGPTPLSRGYEIGLLGESDVLEFRLLSLGGGLLSFVFEGEGGTVTGGPFLNQEAYLGFQFEADDGVHFGYALIREFGGLGGAILETGYETDPGVSIMAGAVPEPSALVLSLIGISVFLRRQRWTFTYGSSGNLVRDFEAGE